MTGAVVCWENISSRNLHLLSLSYFPCVSKRQVVCYHALSERGKFDPTGDGERLPCKLTFVFEWVARDCSCIHLPDSSYWESMRRLILQSLGFYEQRSKQIEVRCMPVIILIFFFQRRKTGSTRIPCTPENTDYSSKARYKYLSSTPQLSLLLSPQAGNFQKKNWTPRAHVCGCSFSKKHFVTNSLLGAVRLFFTF
jgi:hypothetical protein